MPSGSVRPSSCPLEIVPLILQRSPITGRRWAERKKENQSSATKGQWTQRNQCTLKRSPREARKLQVVFAEACCPPRNCSSSHRARGSKAAQRGIHRMARPRCHRSWWTTWTGTTTIHRLTRRSRHRITSVGRSSFRGFRIPRATPRPAGRRCHWRPSNRPWPRRAWLSIPRERTVSSTRQSPCL